MTENIEAILDHWRDQCNQALRHYLKPSEAKASRLSKAMNYAVMNGGKRLRPILCFATGDALGLEIEMLSLPAAVTEMLHSYSLIHDDLPAMDDDDMRRGKPTCHLQFGEAEAILAGDTLQTLAFELLASASAPLDDRQRIAMIGELGRALGFQGMALGQLMDLKIVGRSFTLEGLRQIYNYKTGYLIRASVRLATFCRPGGLDDGLASRLDTYANNLGLAFQIIDDVIDIIAPENETGKTSRSDMNNKKPTWPSLVGLEQSRRDAEHYTERALDSIAPLPQSFNRLRSLAQHLLNRSK